MVTIILNNRNRETKVAILIFLKKERKKYILFFFADYNQINKILLKSRKYQLQESNAARTADVRNFCVEFENAYGKALHIHMQTRKTKPDFLDI